jgi:hypothetical protein
MSRFDDLNFPDEYPTNRVADHEVFMVFRNDHDAIDFRQWWEEKGAAAFQAWLDRNKRKKT